ncbi:MAG: winged helix-turn-helix domain-containing protein, partial [Thermoplasmata archaeon]
ENGRGRIPKTPDLYIVERFLNVLWGSGRELGRTQLQMAVGMNYRRCSVYIDLLQSAGLITVKKDERGREVIKITELGVKVHNALSECVNIFGRTS